MTVPADVPRFDDRQVADLAEQHFGLTGLLVPLPSYADQNVRLTTADGRSWVIKIAHASATAPVLEGQIAALEHLAASPSADLVPTVHPTRDGGTTVTVPGRDGHRHRVHVLTFLPGEPLGPGRHDAALLRSIGSLIARVDAGLDGLAHPALRRDGYIWDLRHAALARNETHRIRPTRRRLLAERVLDTFSRQVAPRFDDLPRAVIHSDANEYNLLVGERDGRRVATGLIDFGDLADTCRVFEPAIAAAYACLGHDEPLTALLEVVAGYHAERPLDSTELEVLLPAMQARLAVSVTMAARSRDERPENAYAVVSESPAWEALERLAGVDPDQVRQRLATACSGDTGSGSRNDDQGALLAARRRLIGPNLSIAYRAPLHMVRGHMQYLFDRHGRPYLDCVNNVCHVGHSHPRVVEAIACQAAALNTNTRYLHDHLLTYAERLTATLPDPLEVCFFVCTGSEANDLALRLARAATGRHGIVAVDAAYHGHTGCLIEISPYKHDGPGGSGTPPHVRIVGMPDPYRRGTGDDPVAGAALAEEVATAAASLAAAGHGTAAFIAESLLGCGGQVVPAPGYMPRAFELARDAGAVCIIDEVQVGFGRVGSCFWAFEALGVVPDIVTMGKPIGNGHPMAAVVTTRAIADAFANGMEYFNTFGGNPVSCAAGLAVLDVIEDEGLQAHAHDVGAALLRDLEALAERHALIGDVRGLGLFLGAELVTDRATPRPGGGRGGGCRRALAPPGHPAVDRRSAPQRAQDQAAAALRARERRTAGRRPRRRPGRPGDRAMKRIRRHASELVALLARGVSRVAVGLMARNLLARGRAEITPPQDDAKRARQTPRAAAQRGRPPERRPRKRRAIAQLQASSWRLRTG